MSFRNYVRKLDGKSPIAEKKRGRSKHRILAEIIAAGSSNFYGPISPGYVVDTEMGDDENDNLGFDDEDLEHEGEYPEGSEQEEVQVTPTTNSIYASTNLYELYQSVLAPNPMWTHLNHPPSQAPDGDEPSSSEF